MATKSPRQMTTRGMLGKLLEYPAIQTVQLNKSSADHMMPYSCKGDVLGTAALAIIEEKPELGTSGEGSVQGSFSFIQHWNDQKVRRLIAARARLLTYSRTWRRHASVRRLSSRLRARGSLCSAP